MTTAALSRLALSFGSLLAFTALAFAQPPRLVAPDEMGSGALLFKSGTPGQYVEAPAVASDFTVTINGPIARTRLTQRFENPANGWVEGVYVFPLPDGAAVDTLTMVVGNRVIVGDVKEKQEAKRIYEEAKAQGQKAALLEQDRPNLFTNQVANIGPHEQVVIQMEYQEAVHRAGDEYQLRVPLVMGPRYNPKAPDTASGTNLVSTQQAAAPDAPPEPPVLDPAFNGPTNPVSLTLTLAPGFAPAKVESPYQAITTESPDGETRVIHFRDGTVPANRDFVLNWTASPTALATASGFIEQVGGERYLLAQVNPPAPKTDAVRKPREVVFVIDNSGSMGGTSITQAKASLLYALGRLSPADRFNVIRFDDTMTTLYAAPVVASADKVAEAKAFVGNLEAQGGTEMLPPLKEALYDQHQEDKSVLRQVIFLTDGDIGNEEEFFRVIGQRAGRSRIFMVGIGSAPNSYLMTRAAELGRGSFTHIGSGEEVEDGMRQLLARIEAPVATGLAAALNGTAEITPNPLPDLFQGEPLTLLAKLDGKANHLQVTGVSNDQPWALELDLAQAKTGAGIGKLWARRRIADAEVAGELGQITSDEADRRILALALEHHLVSRVTSLVAVEKERTRPASEPLSRTEVPLNLPYGWDFEKVFGPRGDIGGTNADDNAARIIKISTKPVTTEHPAESVDLPQTATFADLFLMLGLGLSLLGFGGLAFVRRRQAV